MSESTKTTEPENIDDQLINNDASIETIQEAISESDDANDLQKKSEESVNEVVDEENKLKIFIKNDIIGGYSLAVRDNWGFKILRRHITDREKELFEQEFGEVLLKDDEFFKWWCTVNDINEDALNEESKSQQSMYSNYGNDF